jgi:acyl-CoA thioesterase-1
MKTAVIFFMLLSLASYSQSRIKVACVGNSITEGAGIADGHRYPQQLEKLLGDKYEVRNYGLGGRTLLKRGDFPYWQEDKYKEVLLWEPDIVIIKLGTNDSKPQNWIYADEFESDYRAFVHSFKKLPGKRRIYICLPVPVFNDDVAGITQSILSDEIIPRIKAVGKAEGVKIIDLYSAFKDKSNLLPDGVHPDAGGATIIAEEVYSVVKD